MTIANNRSKCMALSTKIHLPTFQFVLWCLCLCCFHSALPRANAANASPQDGTIFPLLEASGAASGNILVSLAGTGVRLCGGDALLMNTTSGDVFSMQGPTPNVATNYSRAVSLVGAVTVLALSHGSASGGGSLDAVVATPGGVLSMIEISEINDHSAHNSNGRKTSQVRFSDDDSANPITDDNSDASSFYYGADDCSMTVSGAKASVTLGTELESLLDLGDGFIGALAPGQDVVEAHNGDHRHHDVSEPAFTIVKRSITTLDVVDQSDLGLGPSRVGWKFTTAATALVSYNDDDSDGGTSSRFVAAARRDSTSSTFDSVEILLSRCTTTAFVDRERPGRRDHGSVFDCSLVGSTSLNTSRPLVQLTFADLYADGGTMLVAIEDDSTTHMLWLGEGAEPLYSFATSKLDPRSDGSSVRWNDAGIVSMYHSSYALNGEVQIFGVRDSDVMRVPGAAFHVDLLVFGRPEHWSRRRASFVGMRGMQEFKRDFNDSAVNTGNLTAPVDVEALKKILASTHTNTFSWSVCDCKPDWHVERGWDCSSLNGYNDFVRFLVATQGFTVDGQSFRVWVGLYPPSEALSGGSTSCHPPPESNLTNFNETEVFGGEPYTNYERWGVLVGLLAKQYPHVVALDIDDFTLNIGTPDGFSGNTVARITSSMRVSAPWLVFASVVYVPFDAFPDLALVLDAPVFFFRNEKEGAQTCAPSTCVWGPSAKAHTGGCLAGVCSEPTALNVATEVAGVVRGMPVGRRVCVGYYATRHSSLGQPTARYVSRLIQTAVNLPNVDCIMTYTLKSALSGCDEATAPLYNDGLQHQLGCVVAREYEASGGFMKK